MTTDTVELLQSIYLAQVEGNEAFLEGQRLVSLLWGSMLGIGLLVLWIATWSIRGKV